MKYLKLYESFEEDKNKTAQIKTLAKDSSEIAKKMKQIIIPEVIDFLKYYGVAELNIIWFRDPFYVKGGEVHNINLTKNNDIELELLYYDKDGNENDTDYALISEVYDAIDLRDIYNFIMNRSFSEVMCNLIYDHRIMIRDTDIKLLVNNFDEFDFEEDLFQGDEDVKGFLENEILDIEDNIFVDYNFQKLLVEKNPNYLLKLKENNIKINDKIKEEYQDVLDAENLGLFYKG